MLAEGVVGGFQIDQDLNRRESAVEGRRIGRILRQARVGPLRNIAHRRHDVAFDQPRLQEVGHHLIDILLARARHLRQRKRGHRRPWRQRARSTPAPKKLRHQF